MVDRIRALCKGRGISIAALEKELGFANGSIVKSGDKIQYSRVKAIADFFGVTPEYVFFGKDADNFELAGGIARPLSDEEIRLLRAYRNALQGRREAVRALLNIEEG